MIPRQNGRRMDFGMHVAKVSNMDDKHQTISVWMRPSQTWSTRIQILITAKKQLISKNKQFYQEDMLLSLSDDFASDITYFGTVWCGIQSRDLAKGCQYIPKTKVGRSSPTNHYSFQKELIMMDQLTVRYIWRKVCDDQLTNPAKLIGF